MKVIFPEKTNQRYYDIHYKYILNVLLQYGCDVKLENLAPEMNNCFSCIIDKKPVFFDYSDGGLWDHSNKIKVFKFHYTEKDNNLKNVYPFSPVSFYDWQDYENNAFFINYKASGKVFYNQRFYGNAEKRRKYVYEKLKDYYAENLDTKQRSQKTYFEKINEMGVSVHVGGYTECILDRGQFQMMSFGVCTVSADIPEILPYFKKIIPGVHYIKCKTDYSDITEKIDYVLNNKEKAIEIGKNAKNLFEETSNYKRLYDWIKKVINNNIKKEC